MLNYKRFRLGPLHELVLSHDPDDGSVSIDLHRGVDTLARLTVCGPHPSIGANLTLTPRGASEYPLRLQLHALLARAYLSLGGDVAERVAAIIAGRRELETGLDVCLANAGDGPDVMISGCWFADRWSGKASDPRFAVLLRSVLLGVARVETRIVSEQTREVPLPEGLYEVRFTRYERTTGRPRWPFRARSWSFEATVIRGPNGETSIPIPGKGESAHDIEDDGFYSLGLVADTAEEALCELIVRVLERRRRYGGDNWKPSPRVGSAMPEPPPAAAA